MPKMRGEDRWNMESVTLTDLRNSLFYKISGH